MKIKICEKRNRLLSSSNNLIILGGPGSGKTTIALIKAKEEVKSLSSSQKILFLSFARATVAKVIESSSQYIDKVSLKSIEINTYHGFFWNILRSHGYLINNNYPFKILNAADEAVKMANVDPKDKSITRKKIFEQEGIVAFNLFSSLVNRLFSGSKKLKYIISRSYPIIIVDEFQDTNIEEWETVKLLSETSRIIALADPNQRIYDFRGADPARIGQFIEQLKPETFNFENENNRSSTKDITTFGNDLLTGENQRKQYRDVKIFFYKYYGNNRHEIYHPLKTKVMEGIKRLNTGIDWSIAILLPTKSQMLQASNYFSSSKDKLPIIEHDVAIDSEGPELAGNLFAKLLENFTSIEEIKKQIIIHLIDHLKGRKGDNPTQQDLKLSRALQNLLSKNKITGTRRLKLIKEIELIANKRFNLRFTGNPLDDWRSNVDLFNNYKNEDALKNIKEDAKYIRLLHIGSHLRESLNRSWKDYGCYNNASKNFRSVIQKENLSTNIKKSSKINIMTIHKSKGKQFNEVFLFEGLYTGRFVRQPKEQKSVDQSRLILRVGATRAMDRVTILSPDSKKCEIL